MIYLKRLWNLIAMIFAGCFFTFTAPLTFIIELFVIAPILYVLKNEIYMKIYEPVSFRAMWWLASKLMFNTNKK